MKTPLVDSTSPKPTLSEPRRWIVARTAAAAAVSPSEIDLGAPLAHYGFDSRQALSILRELEQLVGRQLSTTAPWEYPTLDALVRYASGAAAGPSAPAPRYTPAPDLDPRDEPLASVGMACRFPRAPDLAAFWRLLADAVDATDDVPLERWDADAYYDEDRAAPAAR